MDPGNVRGRPQSGGTEDEHTEKDRSQGWHTVPLGRAGDLWREGQLS